MFLDDLSLSKTEKNNQTSGKRALENITNSIEDTTTNPFHMEPKDRKKIQDCKKKCIYKQPLPGLTNNYCHASSGQ